MTQFHNLHWLHSTSVVIKVTEMKETGRIIMHIK